jgi:hypothetical protein
MVVWIKKYWFMMGLVTIAAVTMADRQEWAVAAGRWLKGHGHFRHFFFSGLILDPRLMRKGLGDGKASSLWADKKPCRFRPSCRSPSFPNTVWHWQSASYTTSCI